MKDNKYKKIIFIEIILIIISVIFTIIGYVFDIKTCREIGIIFTLGISLVFMLYHIYDLGKAKGTLEMMSSIHDDLIKSAVLHHIAKKMEVVMTFDPKEKDGVGEAISLHLLKSEDEYHFEKLKKMISSKESDINE